MLELSLYLTVVVVLLLINAGGIVLTAIQLPGNWLIIAATALFAWWQWGTPDVRVIGWWTLAILLGLALLGEIVEFAAGALGARTGGGSKRGAAISVVTALAGAILGSVLIPIPIVGTLLGAAIGAGCGAMLGDKWAKRSWREAIKGASGAAVGKLTGAAIKLGIAATMWLIVLIALVF